MKKYNKIDMDTQVIKNSFAGVMIGLVIAFILMVLGTMCIENEIIDISYTGAIIYIILFTSAFFAIILMTPILKSRSVYLAVIIPASMGLVCCVLAIILFDTLCITVLAKVLTLFAGGALGFFVKKALQGTTKAGKRRVRNR